MDTPWRLRRSTPWLVAIAALAVPALAAYTGRSQTPGSSGVVALGYQRPEAGEGDHYRSGISAIDTAGDVTVSPGLGDLPRLQCSGATQVSASVLSPITTGSYTLRCVRLRPDSTGALKATDFTDALCAVPARPDTEDSGYLTNLVTFDTDGCGKVVLLVDAINHPSKAVMDTCSINAGVR